MSCVFVAISSCAESAGAGLDGVDLSPFLPFEPEDSHDWSTPSGNLQLRCWSVLSEAARGSFWSTSAAEALVYDGWIAEERDVPLSHDVATGLSKLIDRRGIDSVADHTAGEWSLLRIDEESGIEAATDFLGARHIYYGKRRGKVVVSNRAMLAAAALHDGELPTMDPRFFAWLLAIVAAPFGAQTPWPSVRRLRLDETLKIRRGHITLSRRRRTPDTGTVDWDRWCDEFVDRCGQVKRFPQVSFRLGLTGGKDSRLVLAGLAAADALDKVKYAYLRAWPEHPDVTVGRHLAGQQGLDFDLVPPQCEGDVFQQIDRHNFQTEYGVNAWDLKGVSSRDRVGTLHGNLGEIYRGHAKLKFALGWNVVRDHYGSDHFVDPLHLLREDAREHCRRIMLDWVGQVQGDDHPRLQVHDAYHRLGRMQGWVGQAQMSDGCGILAINPIPSPGLLRTYQGLGLRQRQAEKVHFELMRRCDDHLWREPFAQDRWSPLLVRALSGRCAPVEKTVHRPPPQLERWRRHRHRIHAYLKDRGATNFFDLVDPIAVDRLLDRAGPEPDFMTLRAIWGLLGIRRALEEPFSRHPIKIQE